MGQLKVDVTTEGIGSANSLGNLTPGDYVTLSAITDLNNSFLGWYDENDNLVSENMEYSFSIHEIKVSSITISQDKASMNNGSSILLTADVSPSDAANKTLKWTSSDTSVAIVDSNGLVTAVGTGQATITASSTDGSNLSASCVITVEKPANGDNSKPSNGQSSGGSSTANPGGTTAPGSTAPGTTVSPNGNPNAGDHSNSEVIKPEPDNGLEIKLLYYIVAFNANGGTNLSRKTMTLLNDDNLGILPKVQRSGYSFSGWYTQKSGGTKVAESTVLNAGTTLYARWSKVAKPAKAKVASLKSSKAGQLTVGFKKVTGAKGYEIAYSTNKKFSSSFTAKAAAASTKKTLKNLKKGKTYYIKVRAYKTDSAGRKIYGAYSSVKKLKVKK